MRFILTGGGTGGHIFPALAIAESLERQNAVEDAHDLLYVGRADSLEAEIVPRMRIPFARVEAYPLRRSWNAGNLFKTGWRNLQGYFQAMRVIKRFAPHAIIATGGYVTLPVATAARQLGIPVFIHEQNSTVGLANRVIGRWAKGVFYSYPNSVRYFRRARSWLTGVPVRRTLVEKANETMRRLDQITELEYPVRVFVVGGSQGSRPINQTFLNTMTLLDPARYQVQWMTGKDDYLYVNKECDQYKCVVHVDPFFEEIQDIYAQTDIAICRSGAGTLAELSLFGIAALMIPFPFATENHQEFNARYFERAGAGEVIIEKDMTQQSLRIVLDRMTADLPTLLRMRRAALTLRKPEAADEIVEHIMETLG